MLKNTLRNIIDSMHLKVWVLLQHVKIDIITPSRGRPHTFSIVRPTKCAVAKLLQFASAGRTAGRTSRDLF